MQTKNRAWYLLKKAVPILPYAAAPALAPLYAARAARLGALAGPVRALSGWFFRLWLPLRALQAARRHELPAPWLRRAKGIARRGFVDIEELAIHHVEDEAMLRTHVRRFEEGALNRVLNPPHWRPGCRLHDKIAFARLCEEAGIAHPVTRATCIDRRLSLLSLPPAGKVFVKPSTGMSGFGAMIVDLSGPAPAEETLRRVAGLTPDWIAQVLVETHTDLRDFALNALPTMRIITLMDEAGAPEIVATTIEVATRPEAVTDNGAQGGLFFGLDPETGVIGLGAKLLGARIFESQPGNGVRMTGRVVPFVAEARAMARAAHARLFPDYAYIGWDVAVAPGGAVMIEGNAKPSMTVAQRAFFRDIGPERFTALIAHHLAQAGAGPASAGAKAPAPQM